MTKDQDYFIKLLASEYHVSDIFDIKDIDEVMRVVVKRHQSNSDPLEPSEYGTLREVLRMFMAENIDRRTREEENSGILQHVHNGVKLIQAIDTRTLPTPKTEENDNRINFAAKIKAALLTPEKIGSYIPGFAAQTLCRLYEKQCEENGTPLKESEKFSLDEWNNSGIGQEFAKLGGFIAKHAAKRLAKSS